MAACVEHRATGKAAPWMAGPSAATKRQGREVTLWQPREETFQPQTTNQATFQKWQVQPRPPVSAKPLNERAADARFEGATTYADMYQAWPLQKRTPMKGRQATLGTDVNGTADWGTTYGSHYTKPAHLSRTMPVRPNTNTFGPSSPMEDMTSYRASYIKHDIAKRASAAPKPREQPSCPFAGSTTYADHYPKHDPMPQTRMRAPTGRVQSAGEFDGTTTHRSAYKEIKLPAMVDRELGAQVVGGRFHKMIKAGARAPAQGKAIFTTTESGQTQVDIVVIAKGKSDALELGHFSICGIAKAAAGVPRISCTYQVLESSGRSQGLVLRVKAHDEANPRTSSVWIGGMP